MFITKEQYNSTIQSYEDTIKALQNRVDELIRANTKLEKTMHCKTKSIRTQYEAALKRRKQCEGDLRKQIDNLKRKNEIYKGFIADPEGFSITCGKLLQKLEEGQYIIED